MTIPIFVPDLPSVDQIAPYLRQVELSRVYSNFGPMVERLHERLASYFGIDVNQLTTLSNATLALEGAIQTISNNETKWVSPSWTYAATNLALERCNVKYELGDIDNNWRLIANHSDSAILDVCSFGDRPLVERFTGLKKTLLVDAAASFPAIQNYGSKLSSFDEPVGVVVSFHPTKILPGIEGGVFLSNKPDWVAEVKKWSKFGMGLESRISTQLGTNAKMSEYQAAVIMASLEKFEVNREKWVALHQKAQDLSLALGLKTHPSMTNGQLSTYWIIESSPSFINAIDKNSNLNGFEVRRWWEHGCHQMPYFQTKVTRVLDETERVANSSIGLPFHLFMEEKEFNHIFQVLSSLQCA